MNANVLRARGRRGWLAVSVAAAVALAASASYAGAATTVSFVSVAKSQSHTRGAITSSEDMVRAGEKIGTDVVTCTFERHVDRCRLVAKLPRGTITAAFIGTGASLSGRLDVLGGTGIHRGAAGAGTYRYLDRLGTRMAVTLGLASSRV